MTSHWLWCSPRIFTLPISDHCVFTEYKLAFKTIKVGSKTLQYWQSLRCAALREANLGTTHTQSRDNLKPEEAGVVTAAPSCSANRKQPKCVLVDSKTGTLSNLYPIYCAVIFVRLALKRLRHSRTTSREACPFNRASLATLWSLANSREGRNNMRISAHVSPNRQYFNVKIFFVKKIMKLTQWGYTIRTIVKKAFDISV